MQIRAETTYVPVDERAYERAYMPRRDHICAPFNPVYVLDGLIFYTQIYTV
jgi:hypothetical protein